MEFSGIRMMGNLSHQIEFEDLPYYVKVNIALVIDNNVNFLHFFDEVNREHFYIAVSKNKQKSSTLMMELKNYYKLY